MSTPATRPYRFLVSHDGLFAEHVALANLANYPGWVDCTDMGPEELQLFVAERQAVRPYIVGIGA